jgi:hypothetical protein
MATLSVPKGICYITGELTTDAVGGINKSRAGLCLNTTTNSAVSSFGLRENVQYFFLTTPRTETAYNTSCIITLSATINIYLVALTSAAVYIVKNIYLYAVKLS